MTGPQNQIVAPGDIVTFNCHARGNNVYWYINGHYGDPEVYNEARGFTFTMNEIPRSHNELEEHNNTITVEARQSNNNTLIVCTASGFTHGQQDYREGYLIIAGSCMCYYKRFQLMNIPVLSTHLFFIIILYIGPPLPPSINLDMELRDDEYFLFTIRWTTPFSWPEFPVTGYTVILSNYSVGEHVNTTFSVIVEGNETQSYLIQFNSTGNECYRLKVFASANSSLGEGQFAIIHTGHPIVGNYNNSNFVNKQIL